MRSGDTFHVDMVNVLKEDLEGRDTVHEISKERKKGMGGILVVHRHKAFEVLTFSELGRIYVRLVR